MIDVLLSTARIAGGGLYVAALVGANPDVFIRGRDGQRANARELRLVGDGTAVGMAEQEASTLTKAAYARLLLGSLF